MAAAADDAQHVLLLQGHSYVACSTGQTPTSGDLHSQSLVPSVSNSRKYLHDKQFLLLTFYMDVACTDARHSPSTSKTLAARVASQQHFNSHSSQADTYALLCCCALQLCCVSWVQQLAVHQMGT